MNERLHSFAVLCYGESPYLRDCLRSLAAQSVGSELLLCTSTPNPLIEQAAKDFHAKYCVNPVHSTIADDWNFAAAQCQTPFYTLAHQDDLYYPRYTETMLSRMEDSIISFCDYEELVGESTRRHTLMLNIKRLLLWRYAFTRSLRSVSAKRSILRFGSAVCCPSVMYNRGRLKDFAFDPSFSVDLDWDAWLRMTALSGAFTYHNEVLMAHRIHEDSETSRQIALSGRNREDRMLMERQWPKPIARLLSKAYAHSTDSNAVRTEGNK